MIFTVIASIHLLLYPSQCSSDRSCCQWKNYKRCTLVRQSRSPSLYLWIDVHIAKDWACG